LKAFGRRPRCKPHRCDRPASETLNNTGSRAASFDYFVGRGHQRNRNGEAEGPGGLQIDDQLESRGLFDGQIGGICAFQYLVDVTNGLVEIIGDLGASAS